MNKLIVLILLSCFYSCSSHPPIDINKPESRDTIRLVFNDHKYHYRYCYQDLYKDSPHQDWPKFKITIKFEIIKSGKTNNVVINEKIPKALKNCIIEETLHLKFPRVEGSNKVEVKQPFNFYPKRN